MDKKILMVIANNNFNDTEYAVPRKIFEENGYSVMVAAGEKGKCYGSGGLEVEADFALGDVNTDMFLAVVFIGGDGTEIYFNDEKALNLARDFNYAEKPVCAICIAPVILAKAGLLSNKKATVWAGSARDLEMVDAVYTAERVTVDGNIVTASGPSAAEEYAEKILELL